MVYHQMLLQDSFCKQCCNELNFNYYNRQIFKDFTIVEIAIKDSSSTEDPLSALQLLRERLRLEISQQKWDNAANSCKFLCKTMTKAIQKLSINEETISQIKKGVTDISVLWADVLVKKGDSLAATQVKNVSFKFDCDATHDIGKY
ncbi:uncharacterized protein LOC144424539 [Styela clava]